MVEGSSPPARAPVDNVVRSVCPSAAITRQATISAVPTTRPLLGSFRLLALCYKSLGVPVINWVLITSGPAAYS